MNLEDYQIEKFYDELFDQYGNPHPMALPLVEQLRGLSSNQLRCKQRAAELALYRMGNTFNVYHNKKGIEKILPFDIIPRIIPADEWKIIEEGLKQRIQALNCFINDIYHEQRILQDNVIPSALVHSSSYYLQQCKGFSPPKNIWIHVTGTDLIRDKDGKFYVLEDNLRCPSGVSYVLESRAIQKRTFPKAFQTMRVRPVSDYVDHLYDTLCYLVGDRYESPNIVVLTPGIYNAAYFEHAYLARQMGVPLVQGSDLVILNDQVMYRTTKGLERVDVIYRRIDDEFLDPEVFRQDSLLGVKGLMSCYQRGTVALANAPGTGIADDKAIYAYVPRMIQFYLSEQPILPNVPTYICADSKQCRYVLSNLENLVVKRVDLSGGSGMLIGQFASQAERLEFAKRIQAAPRYYIAQPILALSRSPTLINDNIEGRHVDIRPYSLYGKTIYTSPGGLTRVALRKGSLIVNSSQGGGSKDTWVLAETDKNKGSETC